MGRHQKHRKKVMTKQDKILFWVAGVGKAFALYAQLKVACTTFANVVISVAGQLPIHGWMVAGIQAASFCIMVAMMGAMLREYKAEMGAIKSASQAKKIIPRWVISLLPSGWKR